MFKGSESIVYPENPDESVLFSPLNPVNHRPGIPLDMMAYHFYAFPAADLKTYEPSSRSTIKSWQCTFFDQAAGFVEKVKYVEAIRKRLSPTTRVNLNELGTYVPGEFDASAARPGA